MRVRKGAADAFAAANVVAARIILADTDRYGGTDSLMVIWARAVLAKATVPPEDAEAGPQFGGRAA